MLNPKTWQEAEKMIGMVKGITKNVKKILIEGRNRIPDFARLIEKFEKTIMEVKFCKYLSNTLQLKDYVSIAQLYHSKFILWIGEKSYVTKEFASSVRELGEKGEIRRIFCEPPPNAARISRKVPVKE